MMAKIISKVFVVCENKFQGKCLEDKKAETNSYQNKLGYSIMLLLDYK